MNMNKYFFTTNPLKINNNNNNFFFIIYIYIYIYNYIVRQDILHGMKCVYNFP